MTDRGEKKLKKTLDGLNKHSVLQLSCVLLAGTSLLIYPEQASAGVHDGIIMCARSIIPSMFPMMLVCTYLLLSGANKPLDRLLGKTVHSLFGLRTESASAVLAGAIGGYPIGAITTARLFTSGAIGSDDAQRLFMFAINGGPAFIISTIGAGIFSDIRTGIVIYVSILLSSVILGVFAKYFYSADCVIVPTGEHANTQPKGAFAASVADSSRAIFGVCSWIVTFSCIGGVISALVTDARYATLVSALLEVSTGTHAAAAEFGAPGAAATAAFAGISVICQIAPYARECGVSLKKMLAFRVAGASLSAFITAGILKVFPTVTNTASPAAVQAITGASVFSGSVKSSVALLIMCALFILDVDYSTKRCYNKHGSETNEANRQQNRT